VPASHDHFSSDCETIVARGGLCLVSEVPDGRRRPARYRATTKNRTAMTTTAHGMVGLVLRFTTINWDQMPCGTNAIASATSARRASVKIRFRRISDRPRREPEASAVGVMSD